MAGVPEEVGEEKEGRDHHGYHQHSGTEEVAMFRVTVEEVTGAFPDAQGDDGQGLVGGVTKYLEWEY